MNKSASSDHAFSRSSGRRESEIEGANSKNSPTSAERVEENASAPFLVCASGWVWRASMKGWEGVAMVAGGDAGLAASGVEMS